MQFLKITGTVLLCLLIGNNIFAQEKNTYVLTGYMGVQGGESFTYKLELKDSTGNYLSGYSYIYKTLNNEVKTAVIAKRDKVQKTLNLLEKNIIYNNNFKSKAVICLVESNLAFNKEDQALKGTLITQTIDNGGMCSTGTILFGNKEEINKLFSDQIPETPERKPNTTTTTAFKSPAINPTQKLNQLMAENKRKEAAENKPAVETKKPAALPPAKITEGKEVVYEWNSDKVLLTIWDGSQEDGDRVTVSFNNLNVLTDYTLKNEKKTLELTLDGEQINTISIAALNEGSQPPNTANITIEDGDKSYEIIAYNKIGKRAFIKIRKKK